MHDLAEHLGTILWIMSGLVTVVGILISITWKDMRKQASEFPGWLKKVDEAGGIVTRDQHFEWCNSSRQKCPAVILLESMSGWRTEMLQRGGILTRQDHDEMCEHRDEKLLERVNECFLRHREWVADQFTILRTEMGQALKKEKKE